MTTKCPECGSRNLFTHCPVRLIQLQNGKWRAIVTLDDIEFTQGATILSCNDCTAEFWSDQAKAA